MGDGLKRARAAARATQRPAPTYAHMCRDDHIQIGHNDSNSEQCPLCRIIGLLRRIEDEWDDGNYLTTSTLGDIREWIGD